MNLLERLLGRPAPRRPDPRAMVSLVVLFSSYEELTCDLVRERLDRAFPGWFIPPREKGTFVVDGVPPGMQFFVNSALPGAGGTFLLFNVPGPYSDVSGYAKLIKDKDMRASALAQRQWHPVRRPAILARTCPGTARSNEKGPRSSRGPFTNPAKEDQAVW